MAKASMRPEVRAQKMKNNKVRKLECHREGCENEFLLATFDTLGKSLRTCSAHYYGETPARLTSVKNRTNREILEKLGLVRV